ncbi:MAG: hypothetical protein ACREQB_04655 [Candidatus Binataceae bacterium]
MNRDAYSSLEAFLAHYRALESARARSANDAEQFAAMKALVDSLDREVGAALTADLRDPTVRRHRERAELKLARELRSRGWLAG